MQRYRGWLAAGAALLVLLAAVWVLGGFAATEPEGVDEVAPGTLVQATPFDVRLHGARAAYEAGGRTAEAKQVYVVVEAQLSLDADESVGVSTMGRAFTATLEDAYDAFGEPAENPDPIVLVAADGSSLLGLGPGLTYDVLLLFAVAETSVPATVEVTLNGHIRRRSSLDDNLGWFDPAPVATVTLDVAPLTGERPEEDF